jgi:hypothetical protein
MNAAMSPREITGVWTDLPLVGSTASRIRGQDLVLGPAGAFLGVCEQELPPWVRFGRWSGGAWEWSTPWTVPPRPEAPEGWADTIDTVDSLWLAVDCLDPMRIAINRTEYQGGSHGMVVGRWGGAFDEIPSPTDSDIRFGQPIVLRGDELWSHDMSALWSFRRVEGAWRGTKTDCIPHFGDGVDELGWHADVSPDGRWVYQDVWSCVAAFERLPGRRGESERFAWTRTVPCSGSVAGLARTPDGLVVVEGTADGGGLRIVLYDEELRPLWRSTVEHCTTATSAAVEGQRVVVHAGDVLLVLDLRAGSVTHRLILPAALAEPGRHALNGSIRVHGEQVCVATDHAIGIYVLS